LFLGSSAVVPFTALFLAFWNCAAFFDAEESNDVEFDKIVNTAQGSRLSKEKSRRIWLRTKIRVIELMLCMYSNIKENVPGHKNLQFSENHQSISRFKLKITEASFLVTRIIRWVYP